VKSLPLGVMELRVGITSAYVASVIALNAIKPRMYIFLIVFAGFDGMLSN